MMSLSLELGGSIHHFSQLPCCSVEKPLFRERPYPSICSFIHSSFIHPDDFTPTTLKSVLPAISKHLLPPLQASAYSRCLLKY